VNVKQPLPRGASPNPDRFRLVIASLPLGDNVLELGLQVGNRGVLVG
jgi:hypothetical protein